VLEAKTADDTHAQGDSAEAAQNAAPESHLLMSIVFFLLAPMARHGAKESL
jgi:hypothetical protein